MGEAKVRTVWCEQCCNRYQDELNSLREQGRVSSRSGVLKVAIKCGRCWGHLPIGSGATAITLNGGPAPWEHAFLKPETGRAHVDDGGASSGSAK